ncbi:MAG: hypothetical protein Q4B54_11175 [Coriobacteriales bacterium]|nr:hypothetical protein [Coriobacteriales bacterium]
MEILLAALQLLRELLGALKAFLELKRSEKEACHFDAPDNNYRPKHLREGR